MFCYLILRVRVLLAEPYREDLKVTTMAGRNVVIAGGAGGVGTIVTRRWLEAGASVLVAGGSQGSLDRLVASLPEELRTRLSTLPTDLTSEAGAEAMAAQAEATFGQPADTLIHLVGGFTMGPMDGPDAPKQWQDMLAANLHSNYYCYRAILPGMKKRGGGWIVGLGSRAARAPGANLTAYATAKAGLVALTESLAAEVRSENIHVNLILASTVDTPANRQAMGEKKAADWVSPDDIADAAFYLCSEAARSVYGATLEVYNRS